MTRTSGRVQEVPACLLARSTRCARGLAPSRPDSGTRQMAGDSSRQVISNPSATRPRVAAGSAQQPEPAMGPRTARRESDTTAAAVEGATGGDYWRREARNMKVGTEASSVARPAARHPVAAVGVMPDGARIASRADAAGRVRAGDRRGKRTDGGNHRRQTAHSRPGFPRCRRRRSSFSTGGRRRRGGPCPGVACTSASEMPRSASMFDAQTLGGAHPCPSALRPDVEGARTPADLAALAGSCD